MILRVPNPQADQVAAEIEAALLASLAVTNTQSENSSFVLEERAPDGRLLAGLTASTSYGWLLVKTLWVDDALRGQGMGRRLMQAAEDKGREIGCHGAWLDTSNPEAHAFYRRLGYSDFGTLQNTPGYHPENHSRWFMKKRLNT
ncbi:MAG: GNAT family N-acetyltransferase [Paracoccaceae bacterium]